MIVSRKKLNFFITDYYSKLKQDNSLRLGKYFCQVFNISNADIYYEIDNYKALKKIIKKPPKK